MWKYYDRAMDWVGGARADAWTWVNGLDRQAWILLLIVMCVAGFVLLKGRGAER